MLDKVKIHDLLFESITYLNYFEELTNELLIIHKKIEVFKFENNHQDKLDELSREFVDNFSKKLFRIFTYVESPIFSIKKNEGIFNLLDKLQISDHFEKKFLNIIKDNFEIVHILKLSRNKIEHKTHSIKFGVPLSITSNFFVISVAYNNFEYRFTNQSLVNLTLQIVYVFKLLCKEFQTTKMKLIPNPNMPKFPNQLLFDNKIISLKKLLK